MVPLRSDSGIAGLVSAGLPTIAIRVPAHQAMQALLRAAGRPLSTPSANASGSISPTRPITLRGHSAGGVHVDRRRRPSRRGLESTIVAATDRRLRLLRGGPIKVEDAFEAEGGEIEALANGEPLRTFEARASTPPKPLPTSS